MAQSNRTRSHLEFTFSSQFRLGTPIAMRNSDADIICFAPTDFYNQYANLANRVVPRTVVHHLANYSHPKTTTTPTPLTMDRKLVLAQPTLSQNAHGTRTAGHKRIHDFERTESPIQTTRQIIQVCSSVEFIYFLNV